MPVYEYKCEECGYGFEKLLFHESKALHCPQCGGTVRKLMSSFSIEIPDDTCSQLPKGEPRELCTECKKGGSACPLTA